MTYKKLIKNPLRIKGTVIKADTFSDDGFTDAQKEKLKLQVKAGLIEEVKTTTKTRAEKEG